MEKKRDFTMYKSIEELRKEIEKDVYEEIKQGMNRGKAKAK